jgi:hypothetical protein
MERDVPTLLPSHISHDSVDKRASSLTRPTPPPLVNTGAGADGIPILEPQLEPELEMMNKGGPSAIPSMEQDLALSPERKQGSDSAIKPAQDQVKEESKWGREEGIRMDRLLNSIEITKVSPTALVAPVQPVQPVTPLPSELLGCIKRSLT